MLREKEISQFGEYRTKLQIPNVYDRMRHAIDTGEVVNTALFNLCNAPSAPYHRMNAFRLIGPKSPEEKDALLLDSVATLREACA